MQPIFCSLFHVSKAIRGVKSFITSARFEWASKHPSAQMNPFLFILAYNNTLRIGPKSMETRPEIKRKQSCFLDTSLYARTLLTLMITITMIIVMRIATSCILFWYSGKGVRRRNLSLVSLRRCVSIVSIYLDKNGKFLPEIKIGHPVESFCLCHVMLEEYSTHEVED